MTDPASKPTNPPPAGTIAPGQGVQRREGAGMGARDRARIKSMNGLIRCTECANQAIGDSNSPAAAMLRAAVRAKVEAGKDDETIRKELIAEHGQKVIYDPPMDATTLLLWASPLLFGVGMFALTRGRVRSSQGGKPGQK